MTEFTAVPLVLIKSQKEYSLQPRTKHSGLPILLTFFFFVEIFLRELV